MRALLMTYVKTLLVLDFVFWPLLQFGCSARLSSVEMNGFCFQVGLPRLGMLFVFQEMSGWIIFGEVFTSTHLFLALPLVGQEVGFIDWLGYV